MNEHIEKAKALRSEAPMVSNCAQTILKVYADELGISQEQAAGLASNFGAGMKSGGVCGAVTAGLVVLGAKGVTDPGQIKAFREGFAAKYDGMLNCSDLLRANTERGGDKKAHCDSMIFASIELIDELTKK